MTTPGADEEDDVATNPLVARVAEMTSSGPLRWEFTQDCFPSYPGDTLADKVRLMLERVVPQLTDDAEKSDAVAAINARIPSSINFNLTAEDLDNIDSLVPKLVEAIEAKKTDSKYPLIGFGTATNQQFSTFIGGAQTRLPPNNPLRLYNARYSLSLHFPSYEDFLQVKNPQLTDLAFKPEVDQFISDHFSGNAFEGIDAAFAEPKAGGWGGTYPKLLTFSAKSLEELGGFLDQLAQNEAALAALRGIVEAEKRDLNPDFGNNVNHGTVVDAGTITPEDTIVARSSLGI